MKHIYFIYERHIFRIAHIRVTHEIHTYMSCMKYTYFPQQLLVSTCTAYIHVYSIQLMYMCISCSLYTCVYEMHKTWSIRVWYSWYICETWNARVYELYEIHILSTALTSSHIYISHTRVIHTAHVHMYSLQLTYMSISYTGSLHSCDVWNTHVYDLYEIQILSTALTSSHMYILYTCVLHTAHLNVYSLQLMYMSISYNSCTYSSACVVVRTYIHACVSASVFVSMSTPLSVRLCICLSSVSVHTCLCLCGTIFMSSFFRKVRVWRLLLQKCRACGEN